MTSEITLPFKFEPRDYQLNLMRALDDGCKRAVVVWSRGLGKDLCAMNYLIKKAMEKPGVYLHCFPNYNQGKRAIWKSVHQTHTGESVNYLDHIPPEIIKHKNSSEMMIQLVNGSIYCVMGLDGKNAVRARGMNPSFVILSEYAFMDPESWRVLEPRVKQNDGTAIFISTPNGQNHFYELFQYAQLDPKNYYSSLVTVDDAKTLTHADIEQLRAEGVPEDFIQQEYFCFPPEQFVMTDQGMKDISLIEPNDMVFTHTGRYRKVLDTISRDYSGDMVRIKSWGSSEDIICTPNHPIRVYERHSQKYRWKQAQHINLKDRVCFPKTKFGKALINENFARLLAWYICEGSGGLNHVQFTVGNHNEAEEISSLAKNLGYESFIRKNTTALNVIINDVSFCDNLKILCGVDSYTKKIPFHLIGGHEQTFLETLIKGDGCISKNDNSCRWCYSTTSKSLAYQVQMLAHSLNYTAGITKRKAHIGIIEGREVECADSYQVNVGSVEIRQESTTLIRSKYNIAACVKEVETFRYEGKVYNLKVQFDETYTVNGRAVHNCSFKRGAEGAYYGKLIQKARDESRICDLPIHPDLPVCTAWDIGIGDSSSIWFFQQLRNGCINFIHYYENHNEGLEHYIKYLNEYKRQHDIEYGRHFVPHDMANREFTSGVDRLQTAREFGYVMDVVPRKPLEEGIQVVRSTLPLCSFDQKSCHYGIKCLDFYRKKYNDVLKVYYSEPCHDKWSHGADAFRMACIGLRTYGTNNRSVENDMLALQKYFG